VPVLYVLFTRMSYGKKQLQWLRDHHEQLMEKAKRVEEQNIDPELEYDIEQAHKEHKENRDALGGAAPQAG
jgi:HAE1 family hydrophobic/amphiphilic exporter-1